MKKESKGLCILAGAGPGDVGLLTLRAREALEQAQVVVYDYLCNPEILKWAPADAEIVFAGKKSGQHTMRQEEINQFLFNEDIHRRRAADGFRRPRTALQTRRSSGFWLAGPLTGASGARGWGVVPERVPMA